MITILIYARPLAAPLTCDRSAVTQASRRRAQRFPRGLPADPRVDTARALGTGLAGAGLAALRAAVVLVALVAPPSEVVARLVATVDLAAGFFGAAAVVAALFGLAVGLTDAVARLDAVPVFAGGLAGLVGVAGLRAVPAAGDAPLADAGLAGAVLADAASPAAGFAAADVPDPARALAAAVFDGFGAARTAGVDAGATLLARLPALAATSSCAGTS